MHKEKQRKAESLFLELRVLRGEALEAALRTRCEGDAELLEEVRSLLAFSAHDSGPLDQSALAMMKLTGDDKGGTGGEALAPGTRVAKYTIVSKLGEGGMGVVYVAQQERPKRTVALKVIRPGLATGSMLRRLEYEA